MQKAFTLSEKNLLQWANQLAGLYKFFGPVLKRRGQTVFENVKRADQLNLDYCSTMTSPRRFVYPPRQGLFEINRLKDDYKEALPKNDEEQIIFAIHPCDTHAISVLDRTFLGDFVDCFYEKLRSNTTTIVLNCNRACDKGFCSSMGTGPFIQLKGGFDIVMTRMEKKFLLEPVSEKGQKLLSQTENLQPALDNDFTEKKSIERHSIASFTKKMDIKGLPELLANNPEHPVYQRTADEKCLGCTNCTMVCPTCYCYNIEDYTAYDLKTSVRGRYWDSCQELNFAKVHHGNFRSSRKARLRQFVMHKLCTWIEQYGCFGCIGCGRCMTWCPTGIDLTEMAREIQQDAKAGKIK